ncbi:MAG: hypothetical protein E7586_00705 [Ruminococcaceae bacterium]|nr:hypothetical protein [Oscillospiraceae bacterium]
MGNHGNTSAGLSQFARTFGADEVHPYTNSPYYHVLKEGENGEKDNLFIFMWMEMGDTAAISTKNVFSADQIDWLEGLLNTYDNDQTNVFVICHSPFLNYGAGDRYKGGGYTNLIDADQPTVYPQNSELKYLLQQHKDVIVMSGHTHLTLYEGANYSDVNNEFAHTVHVPSVTWPRAYTADGSSCPAGTDGRYSADTATYGSEAYLVRVFDDYIVYVGYNLSTGKIIPAACIIIPTDRGEAPTPDDVFEGSGTKDDPYLIQDAQDFLLLTSGFSNDAYDGKGASDGYGAGKYFLQTANIDLSDIDAYMGTYAGSAKDTVLNAHQPAFSGIYNGNGYTLTVDIDGSDSRSVFPYLYGTVANLKIEGSITGTMHANSGGAAMPIARVRDGANVVNCYFDLDLTANETFGVSKGAAANGNIYNVYATGSLTGNSKHAMTNNNVIKNGNAYYNYDGTFTDTIGTKKTAEDVATAFNNTSSAAYTTAKSILDAYGIALHKVAADNGGLIFQ